MSKTYIAFLVIITLVVIAFGLIKLANPGEQPLPVEEFPSANVPAQQPVPATPGLSPDVKF